jgi:hypothetical protein
MRLLIFVIFSFSATLLHGKENNIVCTYTHSYDLKDGYIELAQSSFTVTIEEDQYQNAISGSIGRGGGGLCSYNTIAEYSPSLIWFDECRRPSWLSEDRQTPKGYLKIDRMTGEFTQYAEFPDDKNSLLMLYGTCRAGIQKF